MRSIDDVPAGPGAADQVTLRRANLALVLRRLRDHGPRSRARLATELGRPAPPSRTWSPSSPSAAWSATAAPSAARVGRPATPSSSTATRSAASAPRSTSTTSPPWPSTSPATWSSEHRLAPGRARGSTPSEVHRPAGRAGPARRRPTSPPAAPTPVGLTVGVAGLVDRDRDVAHARPQPRAGTTCRSAALLRERLGSRRTPSSIDNEANLAAHRRGRPRRPAPPGHPGDLRRGRRRRRHRRRRPAAARPAGVRRRVRPHDRRARRAAGAAAAGSGCWETVVGLRRPARRRRRPRRPGARPGPRPRATGWPSSTGAPPSATPGPWPRCDQVGGWVGVGAAILANALNPARDRAQRLLRRGRPCTCARPSRPGCRPACWRPDAGGTRVELSTLGFTAAVRGGAAVALEHRLRTTRPGVERRAVGAARTESRDRAVDRRAAPAARDDAASSRSSPACAPSAASTSTSAPARCTACSARTAPASRR